MQFSEFWFLQVSGWMPFQICVCHLQYEACEQEGCNKRHPKRCRYFFLRGHCKFQENCCYSYSSEDTCKELANVSLEIIKIEKYNHELKKEVDHVKKENKLLANTLNKVRVKFDQLRKEKVAIEAQNKELKEINESLLEDVQDVNCRIGYLIPGKLEIEIAELNKSNAIL